MTQKPEQVALGKRDYKFDDRTVRMATFLAVPPEIKVPTSHDFDALRSKLPIEAWGNDQWSDCVMVGEHHQAARQYRVETRHSLKITDAIVVKNYQDECQRQFGNAPASPGDPNDGGLYVLTALNNWRTTGLSIKSGKTAKPYKLAVYGELDRVDSDQLRAASYLLHGVLFGLSLPRTAYYQWRDGKQWDNSGLADFDSQEGSWGGHLVYAKKYDQGGFYCITWGKEHYMTNSFIQRYADECWATVDALDGVSRYLDVDKLTKYLHDIGATIG